MQDASCRREDVIAAFEDLCHRLERRRNQLWQAYGSATSDMTAQEYVTHEPECWSVLAAGLAGVEAEHRMLQRDVEHRLAMLADEEGAVAS